MDSGHSSSNQKLVFPSCVKSAKERLGGPHFLSHESHSDSTVAWAHRPLLTRWCSQICLYCLSTGRCATGAILRPQHAQTSAEAATQTSSCPLAQLCAPPHRCRFQSCRRHQRDVPAQVPADPRYLRLTPPASRPLQPPGPGQQREAVRVSGHRLAESGQGLLTRRRAHSSCQSSSARGPATAPRVLFDARRGKSRQQSPLPPNTVPEPPLSLSALPAISAGPPGALSPGAQLARE